MPTPSGVFVGTVEVPLSLLYFIKATEARPLEQQRAEYAIPRKARRGSNAEQLPVDGYIDFSRASSVFSDLRLSPLELAQLNFQGTYPALRTQVIGLTQGRCQVEAAKKSHSSLSWTVNLFCIDLAGVEPTASASQGVTGPGSGDSYIESSYPDGYIYAKLREYKDDDAIYARWQGELNAKKRRVIKLIYETPALEAALDRLSAFPGLIESLQLTAYERLLSLHLEDEMVTGLCYIHRYWSKLLRFAMLSPPDKHTVTLLEGRAPAISELDRLTIRRAFARGRVFSGTTDPVKRGRVEQGILATSTMIPGIESFQANLSLLAIAADIIWAHLLPTDLRKVSGNERQSLKSILHGFWLRSQPYVEVEEGLFQPLQGRPSFELAYSVLILSTIRLFPYLSKRKPYKEPSPIQSLAANVNISLALDNNCVFLLHRRARLLGFSTWKIDQGASVPAAPFEVAAPFEMRQMDDERQARFYNRLGRRYGKPFLGMFPLMQSKAFLPTISAAAPGPNFCVTTVLQNFMATFFEYPHMEFDLSLPPISINSGGIYGLGTIAPLTREDGSLLPCIDLTGEQENGGSDMDVDSQSNVVQGMSTESDAGSDSDVIMQDAAPASEPSLVDVDMTED